MPRTGLCIHCQVAQSQGIACPGAAANHHPSPLPFPTASATARAWHCTATRPLGDAAPGWLPGKAASAGPRGKQVAEQGSSYLSKGLALHASCPNKGTVVPCEGPGMLCWRQSRVKSVLGADNVLGCQVLVQRPHGGPASGVSHSGRRQLGGCFRTGAGPGGRRGGKGCPACSGPARMSGRGGESERADGDLGGRVCLRAGRHKDPVDRARSGRARMDVTLRGALLPKPAQGVQGLPGPRADPIQASLAVLAWLQDEAQGQLSPPAAPFPMSAGPWQRHGSRTGGLLPAS